MAISPLMPVYPRCSFRPVKGEGAYLIGEDGTRALDFAAGIAVNALGHAHPKVTQAIATQAATLMHCSNLYGSPQGEAFAQRLCENSFADTVFFTNSGTEAIDCAIKTARRYFSAKGEAHKHTLICFHNAFHGRSLGAISATNQDKMRGGFEPLLEGFAYAPFNDLAAAEAAITPHTAGFMLEPIQGEGGIAVATPEFMHGLKALCEKHDLLLVLDEVQAGYGRTGKLFAHEHYDLAPDIAAIAKGIGNGFPLGACLATERAASGMTLGTHGSTYGGNPLAIAVGEAVADIILDKGFLENVTQMGARLKASIAQLIPNHDTVFDSVRGLGLMLGIKLKEEVNPRDFVAHARDHHALLMAPGAQNVMRILPPLNIDESHIEDFSRRISAAATSWAAKTRG
jgi:acetylornithine/N-succinyldiaminopimelate aminotransferase